ncbi:hypothetical protein BDR07DRAFT_1485419 [Suillus spraguei]|nr:hypothetical protein BDR07DRAFT_1485419 [Suillus spraguei]
MARKKTTTPSANDVGALAVARWTAAETSHLLEYLIAHRTEGGDGMGFKQATFTSASIHLQDLPPLDGTLKENHIVESSRDWQSLQEKYAAIIDIKSQSGFSWDDVLGANVSPADASRWSAFAKMHPDVKLFCCSEKSHADRQNPIFDKRLINVCGGN